MHKIGARYDPHYFVTMQDWYTLNPVALHQGHDVFKLRVFANGMNIRGHHFSNFFAMGMGDRKRVAGTNEEFEPA